MTVGVWLNLDKKSFMAFTKIVESESQIPEVSLDYTYTRIILLTNILQITSFLRMFSVKLRMTILNVSNS